MEDKLKCFHTMLGTLMYEQIDYCFHNTDMPWVSALIKDSNNYYIWQIQPVGFGYIGIWKGKNFIGSYNIHEISEVIMLIYQFEREIEEEI